MKTGILFPILALTILSSSCSLLDLNETDQGDQDYSNHQPSESNSYEENEDSGYIILDQFPDSGSIHCEPQEFELVTNLNVYQTPSLPEPQPRTPYRDPVFGICLVRVTDRRKDILNPYDDSLGMKNEYSRVQSFNADNSLLLVWTTESFWYVYDAQALLPLGEVPVVVEPRWDAHNPSLMYYTDETRLISNHLSTGTRRVIRDFADDFPGGDVVAVWTRYEGSPSYDSRYWGLLAQNADWEPFAFLFYDLLDDDVIVREFSPGYSIDNVTISPLGNYFLASFDDYCEHGQLGNDRHPCGFMVYDRNLQKGRGLLRIIGHYDAALDTDGREVIIYQDIDTDHISMLDLESGAVTPLFPIDFSHSAIGFHFSGRAANLPGWALVSTYNGGYPTDHTWMDDVVLALELKPHGRVVRLAHTHSLVDEDMEHDYWAEPHVSVNQDFNRIIFTSNWGRTGTSEVDMYMILLPDNWTELIP